MTDFTGKVAIITGGAGGLGGATARHLAERGAKVVVTDVSAKSGEALAKEIDGVFLKHDVSDPDAWSKVAAAALGLTGRIDVLVNAAGVEGDLRTGGLATEFAEWRRVMAINLDGVFLGCKAVMPHMMEAKKGAIVNISSIVSCMATPSALAYGASKAGVEQLSRSLAIIGARDGARVRCNSVHPGVIRTRMTDDIIAAFADAQGIKAAEAEAAVCAAVPFGERGVPEDVARLIGYLASDEAPMSPARGSAWTGDGASSAPAEAL